MIKHSFPQVLVILLHCSTITFAETSTLALNPIVPLNGSMVQVSPFTRPPSATVTTTARPGPIARVVNNYNSATLPCCRDRFGEHACQTLKKTHPDVFERRCLSDHDFHTLDCCGQCRSYIEKHKIHPEKARVLFKAPIFCKDKHSLQFCRRFKAHGLGKFSCSDAEFAVRVCRSSCGYCNDGIYSAERMAPMCVLPKRKRLY